MTRNISLYPWLRFFQNLLFWHGIWFLYFQDRLSAADAVLLYVVYDIATTVLEVPSGYMSDRLGRRATLIASAAAGLLGAVLLTAGGGFAAFAVAQVALGASMAFSSGTDTALLYESLAAAGRRDEVERQELRAWRFAFAALALGAMLGGGLALFSFTWPFAAGGLAFAAMLMIAFAFQEPEHAAHPPPQGEELLRIGSLRAAFTHPVLIWLFALDLMTYVLSHVPYVFGQPFILDALAARGIEAGAPAVSGAVSAAMMLVSLLASLYAMRLRWALGLPVILLVALGLQLAVIGVLALSGSVFAIAVLFLRMVPDSLSTPFILARIQPLLSDDSRATYLSLQSFAGRIVFAATLWLAAGVVSDTGAADFAELRQVLGLYSGAGLVALAGLAVAARRVRVEPPTRM